MHTLLAWCFKRHGSEVPDRVGVRVGVKRRAQYQGRSVKHQWEWSGADLAMNSAPMVPLAPGLLSTTTRTPTDGTGPAPRYVQSGRA